MYISEVFKIIKNKVRVDGVGTKDFHVQTKKQLRQKKRLEVMNSLLYKKIKSEKY